MFSSTFLLRYPNFVRDKDKRLFVKVIRLSILLSTCLASYLYYNYKFQRYKGDLIASDLLT